MVWYQVCTYLFKGEEKTWQSLVAEEVGHGLILLIKKAGSSLIDFSYLNRLALRTLTERGSGGGTGGAMGALAPLIVKFRGLSPPKMYCDFPL